jgi:hypothetical protein
LAIAAVVKVAVVSARQDTSTILRIVGLISKYRIQASQRPDMVSVHHSSSGDAEIDVPAEFAD